MGLKKRFSEAEIERFRKTDIRIDRQGEIWHQGEQIKHQRLKKAILSWLDVLPDGRDIIRLDDTRYGYVDIDDAHLLAQSLSWNDDGDATLHLNSGKTKKLNLKGLYVGHGHAMYARHGKIKIRLLTPAYYTLAERIEENEDGFELVTGGKSHPIHID